MPHEKKKNFGFNEQLNGKGDALDVVEVDEKPFIELFIIIKTSEV